MVRSRISSSCRHGPPSTWPTWRSRSVFSASCGFSKAPASSPGEAMANAQLELLAGADAVGRRLDQFLAGPLGSRARAQAVIDAGGVRVDGQLRPKRHLLRGGERVEVVVKESDPAVGSEAADAPFTVRYEDAQLMVVDKPAGVVVHPARGNRTGTLAQALAGRAAGGEDPWR